VPYLFAFKSRGVILNLPVSMLYIRMHNVTAYNMSNLVPVVLMKSSFKAREMNSVEDRDDRAKRMKCSYKER